MDLTKMFMENWPHDLRPLELVLNLTEESVSTLGARYASMRRENDQFWAERDETPPHPAFPMPGDEWVSMVNVLRGIGAALGRGEQLSIDQETADKLTTIARYPSPDHIFVNRHDGSLGISSAFHFEEALLVQAVRGLAHILKMGDKVKLLRCPAPAPGRSASKCEAFFVTGGKEGRPKKYCSTQCARRQEQRSRRLCGSDVKTI